MAQEPRSTPQTIEAIGKLCVSGDRACANDDLAALRHVVRQLADYVPEPIHCELEALAAACTAAPHRVAALWDGLKNQLYREVKK